MSAAPGSVADMAQITIEPVTADRFQDAEHALSGGGDGLSCQCQWWILSSTQWEKTTRDDREQMLHDEVKAGLPPALVAYVDGEPAGWVRVGPRTNQPRLARTKRFGPHSAEPWDDPDVWAVSCFVVRREHRGTGLNAHLLAAAIDYARDSGARVVEAYPLDPAVGRKKSTNDLYHGVLSTFVKAGFREIARPRDDLAIVSLDLQS